MILLIAKGGIAVELAPLPLLAIARGSGILPLIEGVTATSRHTHRHSTESS